MSRSKTSQKVMPARSKREQLALAAAGELDADDERIVLATLEVLLQSGLVGKTRLQRACPLQIEHFYTAFDRLLARGAITVRLVGAQKLVEVTR